MENRSEYSNAITIEGLRKSHYGSEVLHGVGFAARPGEVTAFLGPNGAGKSSTLRILLGLDRADSGTARFGAERYRDISNPLTRVGALFDGLAGNKARSVASHLTIVAESNGIAHTRISEVLEQTGLTEKRRARLGTLSLGEGQRLGLAAALLGKPQFLVLDEPTNGLDPDGIVWLRRVIRRMAAEGRAVLLSSHMLNEAEGLIDDAVFLLDGRVEWAGPYQDVVVAASERYVGLRGSANTFEVAERLAGRGVDVLQAGPDELAVRVEQVAEAEAVVAETGQSVSVTSLGRPSLDLVYHLIRSHGLRHQEVSDRE